MSELPELIEHLRREIGEEATRAIVERWGGTTLYVPAQLADDHPITRAIGRPAADRLVKLFGASQHRIPRCYAELLARRDRAIRAARDAGEGIASIALRFGLTERRVHQILAAGDEPDDQPSLFD